MGMYQPMFYLQAEVNKEHKLWEKNLKVSQFLCAQNESLHE